MARSPAAAQNAQKASSAALLAVSAESELCDAATDGVTALEPSAAAARAERKAIRPTSRADFFRLALEHGAAVRIDQPEPGRSLRKRDLRRHADHGRRVDRPDAALAPDRGVPRGAGRQELQPELARLFGEKADDLGDLLPLLGGQARGASHPRLVLACPRGALSLRHAVPRVPRSGSLRKFTHSTSPFPVRAKAAFAARPRQPQRSLNKFGK